MAIKKANKLKKQKEDFMDDEFIIGNDIIDFDNNPRIAFLSVFLIRFGMTMAFGEFSYHPDQDWQGLEPAYLIAYGDKVDGLTTWEWHDMYTLRSFLYPLYLSLPVHLLKLLRIDTSILVVNSMLMMNALLIATGDYYIYHLTKKHSGRHAAMLSIIYMIFNFRMN